MTTACTTFRLFIQSLSKNYLLFLSFRLLAKALAKVRVFFLTTKFFRSFFSKKFSSGQKPEPQALLAPLAPLR